MRADYEDSIYTEPQMAALHGLSVDGIRRKAKIMGWVRGSRPRTEDERAAAERWTPPPPPPEQPVEEPRLESTELPPDPVPSVQDNQLIVIPTPKAKAEDVSPPPPSMVERDEKETLAAHRRVSMKTMHAIEQCIDRIIAAGSLEEITLKDGRTVFVNATRELKPLADAMKVVVEIDRESFGIAPLDPKRFRNDGDDELRDRKLMAAVMGATVAAIQKSRERFDAMPTHINGHARPVNGTGNGKNGGYDHTSHPGKTSQ